MSEEHNIYKEHYSAISSYIDRRDDEKLLSHLKKIKPDDYNLNLYDIEHKGKTGENLTKLANRSNTLLNNIIKKIIDNDKVEAFEFLLKNNIIDFNDKIFVNSDSEQKNLIEFASQKKATKIFKYLILNIDGENIKKQQHDIKNFHLIFKYDIKISEDKEFIDKYLSLFEKYNCDYKKIIKMISSSDDLDTLGYILSKTKEKLNNNSFLNNKFTGCYLKKEFLITDLILETKKVFFTYQVANGKINKANKETFKEEMSKTNIKKIEILCQVGLDLLYPNIELFLKDQSGSIKITAMELIINENNLYFVEKLSKYYNYKKKLNIKKTLAKLNIDNEASRIFLASLEKEKVERALNFNTTAIKTLKI